MNVPRTLASVTITLAAATLALPSLQASDEAWPAAEEIFDAMRQTYATAQAYVDEGMSTTFFDCSHGDHQRTLAFTTAFVRGGPFRWEFQAASGSDLRGPDEVGQEWNRYVVWSPGTGASSWWSLRGPAIQHFDNVEQALDGPRGVSCGAAADIPGLLMPEMRWSGVIRPSTGIRLVGQERVGGAPCWILEGSTPQGASLRLWVDSETSLIRRVVVEGQIPQCRTKMIREYTPVLADAALALNRTARGIDRDAERDD